ncbi:HlyD family secretion protein [Aestuariicella hydrocarbonica]|uniref:HlyD family secretion protein n=1 Tax=Pseudomaricurvus hydrocarbonicus TaxID=1470433 RepID=A0A9E5T4B2_9GAMM|nr:HlyD family secretion protein [Aestuariicella hydrocarbonica]NHO67923.1 HlyD family secretion protein [Aestuariicella hydrocarbonica]
MSEHSHTAGGPPTDRAANPASAADQRLSQEVHDNAVKAAPGADDAESVAAEKAVKRGGLGLLVLILVTLIWYLTADRFTPYTSQARVQGYVIGVAPKVAGVLTDVWVTNNESVQAGQRLFSIDQSQYALALEKAESDLRNTRKQVEAGEAAVKMSQAKLRAAEAGLLKAQQDYTRLKRLRENDPGTISQRRLELSRASLEQARANVAAAQADIQRAVEQKGGANDADNTLLNTAQTGVDMAQLNLDNTTVVAQTDGVITDMRADVGQFAGTGTPVMTLVAVQDLWINAEFTENNLGHLQPGTPVEILLDALPGEVLQGRIRNIGVGISAGNPPPPGGLPSVQNNRDWLRQAQRFPVQVEFNGPLPPQVLRQLRIGAQATVIAYSEGHGLLRLLGQCYIRLLSYLSYAF